MKLYFADLEQLACLAVNGKKVKTCPYVFVNKIKGGFADRCASISCFYVIKVQNLNFLLTFTGRIFSLMTVLLLFERKENQQVARMVETARFTLYFSSNKNETK